MHRIVTLVCNHIFRAERDVELVIHHSDGFWQMVCGKYDHPSDVSDFTTVGVEHLLARQPGLEAALAIEPGRLAELTAGKWVYASHDD